MREEGLGPGGGAPTVRFRTVDVLREMIGKGHPGDVEGSGKNFGRNKYSNGMTPGQWIGYLKNRGISEEEIYASGVHEYLQHQEKEQRYIRDFIEQVNEKIAKGLKPSKFDLDELRSYKEDARSSGRSPYRKKPPLISAEQLLDVAERAEASSRYRPNAPLGALERTFGFEGGTYVDPVPTVVDGVLVGSAPLGSGGTGRYQMKRLLAAAYHENADALRLRIDPNDGFTPQEIQKYEREFIDFVESLGGRVARQGDEYYVKMTDAMREAAAKGQRFFSARSAGGDAPYEPPEHLKGTYDRLTELRGIPEKVDSAIPLPVRLRSRFLDDVFALDWLGMKTGHTESKQFTDEFDGKQRTRTKIWETPGEIGRAHV